MHIANTTLPSIWVFTLLSFATQLSFMKACLFHGSCQRKVWKMKRTVYFYGKHWSMDSRFPCWLSVLCRWL